MKPETGKTKDGKYFYIYEDKQGISRMFETPYGKGRMLQNLLLNNEVEYLFSKEDVFDIVNYCLSIARDRAINDIENNIYQCREMADQAADFIESSDWYRRASTYSESIEIIKNRLSEALKQHTNDNN